MSEKLTIQQFREIKEQFNDIVSKCDNGELDEEEALRRYYEVQDHLLNYDLSDIPFSEWEGIEIMSSENHKADFSKTRANIDFSLVGYYGNGNFKNCNVRNVENITKGLNPLEFDLEVVKENKVFLSDNFTDEFKNKYYNANLELTDLVALSDEQLEIVKQYALRRLSFDSNLFYLIDYLGIDKVIQFYKHSKEEYNAVLLLLVFNRYINDNSGIMETLKNTDVLNMKNVCFDYVRNQILYSNRYLNEDYPELFKKENPDIFLTGLDIPDEVKTRYFSRILTIQDLLDYKEAFLNIPIDNFMDSSTYIPKIIMDNFGVGKFQELVKQHPDVFKYILEQKDLYEFKKLLKTGNSLEVVFTNAVKEYAARKNAIKKSYENNSYIVSDWLSSMNFNVVEYIYTTDDLLECTNSTFVVNSNRRKTIDNLGLENIKRFERETHFFTYRTSNASDKGMLDAIALVRQPVLEQFNYGSLPYEQFKEHLASCLDIMRRDGIFNKYTSYEWLQGSFRDEHPEIFIEENAPDELKRAFYRNEITPMFLRQHSDYINYLLDKNLANTISISNMKLMLRGLIDEKGNMLPNYANFIEEYTSRYGNRKFLELCIKYGDVLNNITISSINGEFNDEKIVEKSIRDGIYYRIVNENDLDYSYLQDTELKIECPELFIDLSGIDSISQAARDRLTSIFYKRSLQFEDIKRHPELIDILKDKNLFIAFGNMGNQRKNGRIVSSKNSIVEEYSDLELLQVFGNDNFLELCKKYGDCLSGIEKQLCKRLKIVRGRYVDYTNRELTFEEIDKIIEEIVIDRCRKGFISYSKETAPDFLKQKCEDLFLADDAPEELKKYFYGEGRCHMSFMALQQNKEWLPYLKGKSVVASLVRASMYRESILEFFELFGNEKAIKLGSTRAETITEMVKAREVELMKKWYDKTGGKFIPDFVVMQNFPLEEADKFLTSASNWSTLMRIFSFSADPEARDAMLKLAYSFGAFDNDQRGFKKLQELLTGLPRKINSNFDYILVNNQLFNPNNEEILTSLESAAKEENININFEENIFLQIYKMNDDGSFQLTINPQDYPKTSYAIRRLMETLVNFPIVSPNKAHQLFGGFKLKYDSNFREFLLSNIDEILYHPEYASMISNIQKQFSDIKAANSNRVLTLELAVSYVQANKYENVDIGNERVAEVSAITGYNQADFETLQQIFNYGKQRTYSSIPRIENNVEKKSGKYTYEILRLDDPLAMAIGTLTDCCQELGNAAEVSMEHSMVSKHGRIFVIKDELGNIVAQSWTWRNKDVICFDNIEIPGKAFARAMNEHPELGRDGFTDDIYEIYKEASKELIEEDERVYRELLESGKITQEQYDGLRLGKVTVGLGYNDIAKSITTNSLVDQGYTARPLPFTEPVKLYRGLYTKDSTIQHILEEREDRKEYKGETLTIHNDSYMEYSDETFKEKDLLMLNKLEMQTKGNKNYLYTYVNTEKYEHNIVSEIAYNYGLNPKTTRIIMSPNFAIIYDTNDNKIKIGDLLFNTKISSMDDMDIESIVMMQIKLALNQISSNKEVDISALEELEKEMYEKAISITDELDIERGVSNAR